MRISCLQGVHNRNLDIRLSTWYASSRARYEALKFQALDTSLPVHAMKLHLFLTSAISRTVVSFTSSRFTLCKTIRTRRIGIWVDPRIGLNV